MLEKITEKRIKMVGNISMFDNFLNTADNRSLFLSKFLVCDANIRSLSLIKLI